MDPQQLEALFADTLQASSAVRQKAEENLKYISKNPGFLGACLDVIGSASNAGLRQAAAVYFKNQVVRYWNHPTSRIDDGEKPVIKDRIIPTMHKIDHQSRQQLVPVLRVLVSFEFPAAWPELLPQTAEALQRHDSPVSLYVGVLCFSEITRYYRWISNKEREQDLDPMIVQAFPHLLDVGNALLASELTEEYAEILKLILKTYKFVTYYDLPKVLQTQETLASWGQFHCDVIKMATPEYVKNANSERERNQLEVSKCYKWSIANMERLFRRYGSRDLSSKMKYDGFRTLFVSEFVPHLMSIYLSLVEQWCSGARWLPGTALYHLLEFLSHSVTQKESWSLVKPYFETIVSHLIYPLLCPSDETLELFEEDPNDYINSKLDAFDEVAPDIAALGLLATLVSKRRKSTLEPVLQFVYRELSSLQEQQETVEVAKKKEGALRLIGGVSHYLTTPKSPYHTQMESFLKGLVLPNITSQHEFLQARTLDVFSKFADLNFTDAEMLSALFHGILKPFSSDAGDVNLAVMLESALAIQAYMYIPKFRNVLSQLILPTMSKLLELTKEIDNDAISMVMQECVENFSEQLQPFGVELMQNLVNQFMRLAVEVNDAANVDVDEFDGDYMDSSDKIMAAIGLLNTMITVLLSFENSKEICIRLEETFSPVIEYVLANNLDDFLAEIGELIENSIFLLRSVSPVMWNHFGLLVKSFDEGIALMYTEELFQCLRNYMVFGPQDIAENPEIAGHLLNIISIIISGEEDMSYNDIVLALDLAQTFVLSLQGNSIGYLPKLFETVFPVIVKEKHDPKHIKNNAMTVGKVDFIVSCLIYDSSSTLAALQQSQYLNIFMELWFALIPMLKRVYDIKASILGLISLSNNNEAISSIPNLAPHIGSSLATLYKALPGAIKAFETKRVNFSEQPEDVQELYDRHYGNVEEEFEDLDDEENVPGANDASTDEYLNFLQQENNKLTQSGFAEEDEPAYEDPLATTPLDSLNPFDSLKEFYSSLQSQNPQLHSMIFDGLSDSNKQVIVDVLQTVK
ncbi:uncharacterized protein CXQ87_001690 [Candidozyma duobushaemuli]|uniref:Importin N-terminal domain-containing protein n=2 Tax=Candidozyma TaxID=3303203 RepID=A0ABX8I698_9ASCO|nr:uncharacterized protein CXQ87_001690 [[Candida] duobushaemulonis]PVH13582.1 hypothetical protein CXQ87_001690 [[Candida] duobushaemulonis]QWU88180.1 hypothetical protein CA3LBN_002445 [[Candida] haemuloni]